MWFGGYDRFLRAAGVGTEDERTAGAASTASLATVRLFVELTERGIRYCQFKSNMHLAAGLQGLTDLDVLFDARQVADLTEVLGRHGFKRFPAHPSRAYPGVDDFFGLDSSTGRLLHVHVHYRLIAGERFFKNYRLPWEQEFLKRRVADPESGVFVAEPALEWLLLVCRAALKIRLRERLFARAGRSIGERGSLAAEHVWLRSKATEASVVELARLLVDRSTADLVGPCVRGELRFGQLEQLRRAMLRDPSVLRAHGAVAARRLRWAREWRWLVGSVNRRYFQRAFSYARSGAGGGVVIAIVGSDGAGKSSVAALLYRWLAGKIDVLPIYFGSGSGRSSFARLPLRLALAATSRRRRPSSLEPHERRLRKPTVARAVWAVVLAREKRAKLRIAARARERGFIVVCDRYPQAELAGVSDGPLLGPWHESRSRLRRRAAAWEHAIYEHADAVAPDLVIRLLVSPEVAAARRPEDNPSELRFRGEVVKSLRLEHARYGVVDVDGDADLETVLLEVKKRLWHVL